MGLPQPVLQAGEVPADLNLMHIRRIPMKRMLFLVGAALLLQAQSLSYAWPWSGPTAPEAESACIHYDEPQAHPPAEDCTIPCTGTLPIQEAAWDPTRTGDHSTSIESSPDGFAWRPLQFFPCLPGGHPFADPNQAPCGDANSSPFGIGSPSTNPDEWTWPPPSRRHGTGGTLAWIPPFWTSSAGNPTFPPPFCWPQLPWSPPGETTGADECPPGPGYPRYPRDGASPDTIAWQPGSSPAAGPGTPGTDPERSGPLWPDSSPLPPNPGPCPPAAA